MVFQNDPGVKWQLRANCNEMLRDEISIKLEQRQKHPCR